ncbi:TRAFs-binding domain-containing protein [Lacinutrix himadriensis]|uniref:TRAFs-binding domain-containing protein n=1 Tax=Lacinutrix himadriensis TaxID=641549 RepID=UPI0006E3EFF1|nr:TRAFs-binding domain-containing protein [Lacinutrix himadriensis]
MPYYLIVALQAYCIYHLIKNRNEYYWIFLIIFLPFIGCVIYLITQVYNKRDAEKVTNELVTLINPTKKIKDLEKKLEFSETFQNKINLADAYLENKEYQKAISHYELALDSDYKNDFYVIKNLITAYYNLNDFNQVVHYSEKIKEHPEFKKSKAQFVYGLALEKSGRIEEAESQLRAIDNRYSNYEERFILAKFLIAINKTEEAKEILNEMYIESQHMTKRNGKKYRTTFRNVEKLLKSV